MEACVRLHLAFGALSLHPGDELPRLFSLGELLVEEKPAHLAAGQAKAVGDNHMEIIPLTHRFPRHCTPRSVAQQDGSQILQPPGVDVGQADLGVDAQQSALPPVPYRGEVLHFWQLLSTQRLPNQFGDGSRDFVADVDI